MQYVLATGNLRVQRFALSCPHHFYELFTNTIVPFFAGRKHRLIFLLFPSNPARIPAVNNHNGGSSDRNEHRFTNKTL
jgi:hypothetical protein